MTARELEVLQQRALLGSLVMKKLAHRLTEPANDPLGGSTRTVFRLLREAGERRINMSTPAGHLEASRTNVGTPGRGYRDRAHLPFGRKPERNDGYLYPRRWMCGA
jgi:hypothetical protein